MAKQQPKPGSFEERWMHRQRECGQEGLGLPDFLTCDDAILPTRAAPFLSFDEAEKRPRIWEVFGPKDYWSEADKVRLARYRMIGSDGCGNPICLEDETGVVWMLDHEDHFKTRQFVNSNLLALGESLLACMGEQNPSRLLGAIEKLDSPAVSMRTFWSEAAACFASLEDAE